LEVLDTAIVILKFVGLAVAGAIGLLSFLTTKNWEERDVQGGLIVPGQPPKKERHLTRWGKWSFGLLIFSGLVTLCAQIAETVRAHQKETAEATEKLNERNQAAKEKEKERERFAREKEQDRKEFDRRLSEERAKYLASTAEFFLLKNDLERQRMQTTEAVRTSKVDLKIPAASDPLPSSPEITAAFESALKAIPQAIKNAAILRNKEEIERMKEAMPFEARAHEIETATHSNLVRIIDLYRSTLVMANKKGIIALTDLGPAPMLPDQIVFSTKSTNNQYGRIAENIAQTSEFAHGDRWHAYLVLGLVDSIDRTNSDWYPKFRYKDRSDTIATIWFDPAVGDVMYASSRGRGSATSTVATVTSIIEDLKTSRINSIKNTTQP
jgi:hypothetical protein